MWLLTVAHKSRPLHVPVARLSGSSGEMRCSQQALPTFSKKDLGSAAAVPGYEAWLSWITCMQRARGHDAKQRQQLTRTLGGLRLSYGRGFSSILQHQNRMPLK